MKQEAKKVELRFGPGTLKSTLIASGLLALSSGASAQGYFSFEDIPGLEDSEPTVAIDLDPEMMKFFGAATKGPGQQFSSALEGITNVRVRVYEDIADGAQADLMKFVEDTSRTLERDGWRSVVRVNEDGERVRIFMKLAAGGANAGSIEGLTVMVVDTGGGDEAVFINLAGAIRPEQLGSVAAQMGMDGMFNMVPGAQFAPDKGPNNDL
jgi:hypothetical protein